MREKYNKLNELVLNICKELSNADDKYYTPYGEFIVYVNACDRIKKLILQEKENINGEVDIKIYG